MAESLCRSCNKPKLAGRAGSITSYFFQHNYCRCDIVENSAGRVAAKKEVGADFNTCASCGKVKSENKRAGSFSAFLFQELRCTCGGKVAVRGQGQSLKKSTIRQTADRKKFTASLRKTNFTQQESLPRLLPTGTIVANVFRIMSVVGQGGMGAVYLAQHTGLQRSFALKVLLPDLVNEQTWQRFKAEARTIAALNHPTIVKVYDLGIHENSLPFYSMDYVTGITLEDYLIEEGALSVEHAVQIFSQVLEGLAYAHRNGIVHRDIKPANIMFGTLGKNALDGVKILDFGIAKLLHSDSGKQGLTMAGEVFGSPFYMSPEQSIGGHVDARSDIYSLGCAFFEALTLNVPFDAELPFDILTMHQSNTPPRLNDFSQDSEFSDSLECVIAKCLAKLPDERYQSAKELVLDLERIKDGKDLSKYPHLARQFAELGGIDSATRFSFDDHENRHEPRVDKKLLDQSAVRLSLVFMLGVFPIILGLSFWVMSSINALKEQPRYAHQLNESSGSIVDMKDNNSIAEVNDEGVLTQKFDPATAKTIEAYLKTRTAPYAAHPPNAIKGKKYFDFPSEFSLGNIRFIAPGLKAAQASATGKMMLPADSSVDFTSNPNTAQYPELFKFFQADDLNFVQLYKYAGKSIPLKYLQHLTGIVGLDLANHESTNDDVAVIEKFRHLKSLKLGLNSIKGKVLAQCAILPQLKGLTINRIDDCMPVLKVLLKAKKIYYLGLVGNLRPAEIRLVSQLTSLDTLSLVNMQLTDDDCKLLSGLENLKLLEISGAPVDAEKLRALSKLNKLQFLSFDKIDSEPAEIILQLQSFKKLNRLSIPSSVGISPASLAKALPHVMISQTGRENSFRLITE